MIHGSITYIPWQITPNTQLPLTPDNVTVTHQPLFLDYETSFQMKLILTLEAALQDISQGRVNGEIRIMGVCGWSLEPQFQQCLKVQSSTSFLRFMQSLNWNLLLSRSIRSSRPAQGLHGYGLALPSQDLNVRGFSPEARTDSIDSIKSATSDSKVPGKCKTLDFMFGILLFLPLRLQTKCFYCLFLLQIPL